MARAMTMEKKKERLLLTGGRIYLWLMLLGLPLVLHDGYFDITETKTLWFAIGSVAFLLFRGVLELQYGRTPVRLGAGEICALALAGLVLFSCALSGRFWESFFGPAGRWQGAGMLWIYAALYLAAAGIPFRERDLLLPLGIGLALCSILAVWQHLGGDPLGLFSLLVESDQGRYISTLGNINFAGAYFSLTLPVFVHTLLREERSRVRAALGGLCLLGLWGAMAMRSESTVLGLGAALVLMPFLLRGSGAAVRRWPLVWPALAVGLQLYGWIARAGGAWLSEITRFLLRPAVSLLLAAAGLGLWLLLRRRTDNAPRRVVKAYAAALGAVLVLGVLGLAAVNTVWRTVPLGAAEAWLRFSESWGTDRVKIWTYCLSLYREFPFPDKLLGGGCGVLARLDTTRRIFPDAILDAAHCEYLQLLLNWGCLGLLAYLGWLACTAGDILRRADPTALALLAGLAGYAVQAAVNIAQAPGISLFFLLLAAARRRGSSVGH